MESPRYNWNADDYAKNSSAQLKWAEELIAKLELKGCESVLDIGCGDGKISTRLAQLVKDGHVLGIDSSVSMIQHASTWFPTTAIPNLSFRRMDASEISLEEKFDVAFSNAALHWIADQNAVLRGVRSCLKTDGRILFQMGGRGNAAEAFDIVRSIIRQPSWRQYFDGFEPPYHFHDSDEYKGWLVENGFRPIRVELIPKDMRHEGVEGLKGWIRTVWLPYTDRLPLKLRDVFIGELAETYIAAHPLDVQGNTHLRMIRLEVEACVL